MGELALLLEGHPSRGRWRLVYYFSALLGPFFEPFYHVLLLSLPVKHGLKAFGIAMFICSPIDFSHFVISTESVNHPIIKEMDLIDRIVRYRYRTLCFHISVFNLIKPTFQFCESIAKTDILNLTFMVVFTSFLPFQHSLDLKHFWEVADVVMLEIEWQKFRELT